MNSLASLLRILTIPIGIYLGVSKKAIFGMGYMKYKKVSYAAFKLNGFAFSAMDNGYDVDYTFNEAFSFIVNCKNQEEIDYYWEKLSAVPEAESCGWCKDQFGVSWQILPSDWEEVLFGGTEEQVQRVNDAVLNMKKFDLEALEKARLGVPN